VAQEIAAEEVSGLDAVGFQKCGQVVAGFGGKLRRVVLFDKGKDLGADGFRGGGHFPNFHMRLR
jgi:hypothetical protein